MFWEDLTEGKFKEAVQETGGVCILPIGAIEKHGPHLPLGTDIFQCRKAAEMAVEKEKALIFPYFPFAQITEAAHCAGTIVTEMNLMLSILDSVCSEIARNGCKKILILNGHGGNPPMLNYFMLTQLRRKKDYVVYFQNLADMSRATDEEKKRIVDAMDGGNMGIHAGNLETSLMMAIRPDLVDLSVAGNEDPNAMGRLNGLKQAGISNTISWYADFPNHYAGDPSSASAKAGEVILEVIADRIAAAIKEIKQDDVSLKLLEEFYGKHEH